MLALQQSSTKSGRHARESSKEMAPRCSDYQQQWMGVEPVHRQLGESDPDRLDRFDKMLQREGIDTSQWGLEGTKTVEHLFVETFEQRGCIIMGGWSPGQLKRVVRLVKIKLIAEIFGVPHMLYSRLQIQNNGHCMERKQLPLKKLTWTKGTDGGKSEWDQKFCEESCPYTEDWRSGCRTLLQNRLGLSTGWQDRHLEEDMHAYAYRTEDDIISAGFPGLNSLYCIHEITFRVVDPSHVDVQTIGLPNGQEFATTEGDFDVNDAALDKQRSIGSQFNIWTWVRPPDEAEQRKIKRVPLPDSLVASVRSGGEDECAWLRAPNAVLGRNLGGQRTDWAKVRAVAGQIGDSGYSLRDFSRDILAFPELSLYLLEDDATNKASSGRTFGDEYQRTIGAFFAIYWLVRLRHDGKEGFSFGVDHNDWRPIRPSLYSDERLYPAEKRRNFYSEIRWEHFERLLLDAELVAQDPKAEGGLRVQEERMVTLLALTAIHDIMKMEVLLPCVQPEHAPYHGYMPGDQIGDHDHALSYVLDHYPELLPSFSGLPPEAQRAVQFTQCQLSFNHGWVVQAEAPPGALFTKLKEVMASQGAGLHQRDMALYFVHWLTDLAGAEPTPLGGCEKFVIKFPLPVLNSFLRSFELLERIVCCTETELFEEYLKIRWKEWSPALGPLPQGGDAVAKMRLVCMAQANARSILTGFQDLRAEDRGLLSVEMARTGCEGQAYSPGVCPQVEQLEGPALLIYYGPAFLQSLGTDRPADRLAVLAEIYRCARQLWPPSSCEAGQTVVVRIDAVKAKSIEDMREVCQRGLLWVLLKPNRSEAFVKQLSARQLNEVMGSQDQAVQVMDMSTICANKGA